MHRFLFVVSLYCYAVTKEKSGVEIRYSTPYQVWSSYEPARRTVAPGWERLSIEEKDEGTRMNFS